MENLLKLIGSHFVTVLLFFIGAFMPGVLTIAIYNRPLFLELEFLKLLLLVPGIGLFPAVGLFLVMILSLPELGYANNDEVAINYALCKSIIIYGIALICKIVYRPLDLRGFVVVLLVVFLLFVLFWCLVEKESIRSSLKDDQDN